MRYSTKSKFRKYVKGYDFLSFARKFDDKYDKTLMDTATKTASKRVVQKAAEATGDLIGNKIADKITSVSKTKRKRRWKTRKLHTTRKKTANYWPIEIVLTPYKNGIPKNFKPIRYNIS